MSKREPTYEELKARLTEAQEVIGSLRARQADGAAERAREVETSRYEANRLFNVLDAMADGAYIVDQQYDIEYVNPVLHKDFGPYEGRKCYEYWGYALDSRSYYI